MYMNTIISMLSFTFWLTNLFVVASRNKVWEDKIIGNRVLLTRVVITRDDIKKFFTETKRKFRCPSEEKIIVDIYI